MYADEVRGSGFNPCGTISLQFHPKLRSGWAIRPKNRAVAGGYGEAVGFERVGVPKDLASPQRLASDNPHGFQFWITLKLGGWPWMGGRKGGDKSVDGYFYHVGRAARPRGG